jgi:hypothetical protein
MREWRHPDTHEIHWRLEARADRASLLAQAPPTSLDWNQVSSWLEGVDNLRRVLEPALFGAPNGQGKRP